jgi:hypothetical protein
MIATITALLLALAAGYLIGGQRERDRHHNRRTPDTQHPTPPAETLLSDREWERFVCAIYDLADRDDPGTRQ